MWSPSDTLLAEYLAGQCADADACAIERWVAEDPANRARFEELRVIWQGPWPPAAPSVDAMWTGVREAMNAERADWASVVRRRRTFQVERRPWYRRHVPAVAAAAVALAVGGGAFVLWRGTYDTGKSVAAASMREYTTPRGQRATFQLSDGTHLILAAASRLRVPADYGRQTREVYLEGEALFDVTHDAKRPFRVRANGAVAEDIGTRFDVRAYPGDSVVAVAVAEGVVALGRDDVTDAGRRAIGDVAQGVILRKGDLGTLAADGSVTTANGEVTEAHLAWVEGRLRFVETPLPEVLRVVSRWYDLDVRVGSPALAARTVTAEFTVQSRAELVRALALALDARVSQSGKIVTLHPRS